ncbi:hypothetical protein LTSEUGA_0526 [Salmonella enterica subsp. enterica serovar Uganda str. R8-3404]|uniref:Uncharacterized protein n=1 Tax=Salmonella enterica subsp. enterica serovar Uganda str. R8-3404 TaxID=913083 RepID=A0A6C8H6I8_SALET|nr:hypothetical protein LTSEUGA_0526 [Salmonella enterica subsp. enterica serovar Uganda str. R8-3404]
MAGKAPLLGCRQPLALFPFLRCDAQPELHIDHTERSNLSPLLPEAIYCS